ncbi:MAG TPA: ABC transporter permease [Candidatus Elarobacter sp.]|nr:ABC transporter permease [Candidatus Elarobacter sp.]
MRRLVAYTEEAARALWTNRTRSVLTMLGMIIGTSSIIAVFGMSAGATTGIAATLSSFGTNPVAIRVDTTQDYPQYAQFRYRDAKRVEADLGGLVTRVAPFYFRNWQVRRGNEQHVVAIVTGGDNDGSKIPMREGRPLNPFDNDTAARVCVLTDDVARTFFGDAPAVGKDIIINGSRYTVVGVFPKLNGSLINSVAGSNTVGIPYSTLHRTDASAPDDLEVYPADPMQADRVGELATSVLQHIHGPHAKYTVVNGAAMIANVEQTLRVIGFGLSAIGAVSLLVAGIGIMNIMLVSVVERTREIGIRKSIGASRTDIALQFLMESLLLSLAGGGAGMLVGLLATAGGAQLISNALGTVIIPYVLVVCIALAFSTAIGVAFGMYPALRAASMDPIKALRS